MLIKFLRKVLLGCTLRELSARSGVHTNLLSRYERGTVQPTSRNLDRILSAAGVLEIRQPLLLAFDHLAALLTPMPSGALPDLRDLLQRTSHRLLQLQPDSRLSSGEYHRPIRRDFVSTALLTRFLRTVLLDCTQRELSRRTGIHEDVLSRYENGRVDQPSPENLDRLLAEARVLHLKEPLLAAMSDLSTLLSSPSRSAQSLDLAPDRIEAFLDFYAELTHRISETLYSKQAPPGRDVLLDE